MRSTPPRRPKESENIATLPSIAPNPDRRYYIYFRMCKRSVRRTCDPFLRSQHRACVAMERSPLLSAPECTRIQVGIMAVSPYLDHSQGCGAGKIPDSRFRMRRLGFPRCEDKSVWSRHRSCHSPRTVPFFFYAILCRQCSRHDGHAMPAKRTLNSHP